VSATQRASTGPSAGSSAWALQIVSR
jgi:hypothetical protein